jgi:hypothetical protein
MEETKLNSGNGMVPWKENGLGNGSECGQSRGRVKDEWVAV